MKYKKMNKKGAFWFIPIVLVGIVVGAITIPSISTFISGLLAGNKISSGLESIPFWFWIVLIVILFLILTSKRSKR